VRVRLARAGDGDALAALYAPMVTETAVTFELEPPSGAEMARRVAATLPSHPWLVIDDETGVLGYAYAHRFHERAAYDWSVETSIYIDASQRGRGVGRSLYTALITVLRAQGYRQAVAGIALPNPASVKLHEAVGFEHVGDYHRVGWKHGAWHDVGMWALDLQPDGGSPSPAVPVGAIPSGLLA
jgi:phosphinothricin acetyltransferase